MLASLLSLREGKPQLRFEAMAGNGKPPVLVVVQLSGGNDFMNTIVPYASPVYHDVRKKIKVEQDEVLPIDDSIGFNPNLAPLKEMYDAGDVAIVQGIGFPDSDRSHFRAMDIWHTCEPKRIVLEGWLGKTIRELDPNKENVLTGVNIGRGLPRALTAAGVPVASVGDLDSFGLMTGISEEAERTEALDVFKEMYSPAIGSGPVMEFLANTGEDVLRGQDMLAEVPGRYSSDVEYADNAFAKSLRDVARVHLADVGARVLYTSQGGYDTHANEMPLHPPLLRNLSRGIMDFFQDLRDHQASEEVVMMVFTEFGRRMHDNGSGTDHGTGGGAFIIGDRVMGGLYSEYPSMKRERWARGEDLEHTYDFRGLYSTVLQQWLGVEAAPIVNGAFEQIEPFA